MELIRSALLKSWGKTERSPPQAGMPRFQRTGPGALAATSMHTNPGVFPLPEKNLRQIYFPSGDRRSRSFGHVVST